MTSAKRAEFFPLFRRFVDEFLRTPEGETYLERNRIAADQGRENYHLVLDAAARGEDITELVLTRLFPHRDTPGARAEGRWVTPAPAIIKDIKSLFGSRGGREPADWPRIARAVLRFVQRSATDPARLDEACREFTAHNYRGFQSGMLTPILNALRPDDFVPINGRSIRVLCYFTERKLRTTLSHYPEVNRIARHLIDETAAEMVRLAGGEEVSATLLFDMFASWLDREWKQHRRQEGEKMEALLEKIESDEADRVGDPIAQMFERFYPDPAERRACARILADAIEYANTLNPANWAVAYRNDEDQLTLTVGPIETLLLLPKKIQLLLAADVVRERLRRTFANALADVNDLPDAISGPIVRGEVPSNKASMFEARMRLAHRACIERASRVEVWRSGQWPAHDPDIITFLRAYLGRPLPEPASAVDREEEAIDPPATEKSPTRYPNPELPLPTVAEFTGFPASTLESWVRAIERKKQAILYGPPGTGKTFIARRLAEHLVGGSDGFVEIVQFHPAYSYEDFIEGIRPQLTPSGQLDYALVPGRFLRFCAQAREHSGICVLIVDEINRANLARVFGELMYLLEYRDEAIPLVGGTPFSIPENVRVIGTMNTADRSIALVDHALRRRFAFLELRPQYDVLVAYHRKNETGFPAELLAEQLRQLNLEITDPHYEVGISFFMRPDLASQIGEIWRMEIEPYLREYFFDRPAKAEAFSWEKIKSQVLP